MPESTSDWALHAAGARLQPARQPLSTVPAVGRPAAREDVLAWVASAWTARRHTADPSLDQLADAAVHGMRNSLSAVLLGTELLGRRDPTQGVREMPGVLEHIANAAARAEEQAEELADLGRLAAGRSIGAAMRPFPLHSTVAQVLADALGGRCVGAIEHDRLGQGDAHGDVARIAQFIRLALEEVGSMQAAALGRIVVSEVAGMRFRIAVYSVASVSGASSVEALPRLASASRRARIRGIAQAHRGSVRFGPALAGAAPFVEGWFHGPTV